MEDEKPPPWIWFAPWQWHRDTWAGIVVAVGLFVVSLPLVDLVLEKARLKAMIVPLMDDWCRTFHDQLIRYFQ